MIQDSICIVKYVHKFFSAVAYLPVNTFVKVTVILTVELRRLALM